MFIIYCNHIKLTCIINFKVNLLTFLTRGVLSKLRLCMCTVNPQHLSMLKFYCRNIISYCIVASKGVFKGG